MTVFNQCYAFIALIYLMFLTYITDALPLTTNWNEGKIHFIIHSAKLRSMVSWYNVKWNYNYERYAKKLAETCGDEYTKIETLLYANIYTSILDDLNWVRAYEEWEEDKAYRNNFPQNNLDSPAYVGCASAKCGQQTYHVCAFNHYLLHYNPSDYN